MCFDKYLPCAWLSKDGYIININKYLLSTYCVPGTMWGAKALWDSGYFEGVLTQANPRSRPQSCQGVILVTDMDHHPLAVNNDSRQSCLTGSYWSPSCILLVTTLKDAYFEELNHMEGKKNHNATYKSRSREALKSQVNSPVRDSSIHREGEGKPKQVHDVDEKKIKWYYSAISNF